MTITQLKYIVAVADTQHFAKAAAKCFVSQPTLSVQIKNLEDSLGVMIFDRTRHPIVTTLAGERIVAQARLVIQEHHKIRDIASEANNVIEGEFRLGVIPTVATNLIPLFFAAFHKAYPQVWLTIEEMNTAEVLRALANDELDGGIAATPLGVPEVDEAPLYYEEFFIYAGPGFGKSPGAKVSQDDIMMHDLLLLREGHCFRDQALQLCGSGSQARAGIKYEGGNFETLMKLVDAGSGVTLIPQLTALSLSTAQYKAQVYGFKGPVPKREISLITRRRYAKAGIVEAISEIVVECLPGNIEVKKKRAGRVISPPLLRL